jgi:hypothetical protein
VTPFKEAELQPDGAVGINCFDIAGYFCPIDGACVDFAFLEGFLVVKSPVPLDVVGVYTARHTDGEVEAIDVEAAEARQVRETAKLVPQSRLGRGEVNGSNIPPRGALPMGEKNRSKCAAVLPDFHVLKARSVWMILQTIATRQEAGLIALASA